MCEMNAKSGHGIPSKARDKAVPLHNGAGGETLVGEVDGV
jgi:hypothetical protein